MRIEEKTISFSLLINLVENKSGSKYVVFKPYLTIFFTDETALKKDLGKNNVIKYKHYKTKIGLNKVVIQHIPTIKSYIANNDLYNIRLIDKIFKIIDENGYIFKEYHDFFEDLIMLKLSLNSINKGYGKMEWIMKIRKFLGETQ